MAFIDVVEWNDATNDVFAWKFGQNKNNNLSTFTQLIVRESQEAVLFSKGQILGKFGPGKHTLNTENLPLLRNLFGIPFGGKNPFTAEVWFVNKTAPLAIDWRTDAMRYRDPEYGEMVPLAAKGRYGLKVEDAERFLVQLVGTLTDFTARDLTDHFLGALVAKTKSVVIAFMQANQVGITTISARLDDLSRFLKEPLREFWESYGMLLTGFYITSVDLDTSTEDGKKIAAALSDRSAQNIAGYTWQQKQGFGVANNAVSRNGDMGVLGAMAMTGMMGGGAAAAMMQPPYMPAGGAAQTPLAGRKEVFCSRCAKKYPATSHFCPYCGNKYNPCPRCGSDNIAGTKRCVSCGAGLAAEQAGGGVGNVCPRCGQPAPLGVKFCAVCGNKLT
ncbi:MAG: SPFH domain-containing protein [Treponema sp.]|jgi:membrane protease subunit (stomatin/prohibitin family)|nr:SPFH domain-containing protein [Treponema sp.]